MKWNPGPRSISDECQGKDSKGRLAICLIDFGRAKDVRFEGYKTRIPDNYNYHENNLHISENNGNNENFNKNFNNNVPNQDEKKVEINTKYVPEIFSKRTKSDKYNKMQNYNSVSTNIEGNSTCALDDKLSSYYDLPIMTDNLTNLIEKEVEKKEDEEEIKKDDENKIVFFHEKNKENVENKVVNEVESDMLENVFFVGDTGAKGFACTEMTNYGNSDPGSLRQLHPWSYEVHDLYLLLIIVILSAYISLSHSIALSFSFSLTLCVSHLGAALSLRRSSCFSSSLSQSFSLMSSLSFAFELIPFRLSLSLFLSLSPSLFPSLPLSFSRCLSFSLSISAYLISLSPSS